MKLYYYLLFIGIFFFIVLSSEVFIFVAGFFIFYCRKVFCVEIKSFFYNNNLLYFKSFILLKV